MQPNLLRNLAASIFLDWRPEVIRNRLSRDEAWGHAFGFTFPRVIHVPGDIAIAQDELFSAARRALASRIDQVVECFGNKEVEISIQEGSVVLRIPQDQGNPLLIPFAELALLSSNSAERLRALATSIQAIGPAGPDFSALRKTAEERELSDSEVGNILDAQMNGVVRFQARLEGQLQTGRATLDDLIPASLSYFEHFCGPDPGDMAPEIYFLSILPQYRRELLARELSQGLAICLIGNLRDDLCPGAWLDHVSDDEVWTALSACRTELDPFSLLGALDIALYRLRDDRFRALAENAVDILIAEHLPESGGFDTYPLLPSLATFALERIQLSEGGALRVPFWKRMCAWMQATKVSQYLSSTHLDVEMLRDALQQHSSMAARWASIVDLRREPMAQAGNFTPQALRWEVVSRLLNVLGRHESAGRELQGASAAREIALRLSEVGPPRCLALPGPLEGYLRPSDLGRDLPEESKRGLLEFSPEEILANLVNLSQHFHLDQELRSLTGSLATRVDLAGEDLDIPATLRKLISVACVAASERDPDLARVLVDRVFSITSRLRDAPCVALGLQCLLVASAAFSEEKEWAEWLEKRLAEFAGQLPTGQPAAFLYGQLLDLRRVTRLELRITCRAEALASAAS